MADIELQTNTDSTSYSIQLRSKFIKNFPDSHIQETVLQRCEELNELSVPEAFHILMCTAASVSELLKFIQLEPLDVADTQVQLIWNELRSQYNTAHHVFPSAELFFSSSISYVRICSSVSTDYASAIFKCLIMYLNSHSVEEHSHLLYILSNSNVRNQIGGLYELGLDYKQDRNLLINVGDISRLLKGLMTNNCYLSAVNFVDELCDYSSFNKNASMEENAIFVGESNNSLNGSELSFDSVLKFINNYDLLADTLDCFVELREVGIDPRFLLDRESELSKCLKELDNFVQLCKEK